MDNRIEDELEKLSSSTNHNDSSVSSSSARHPMNDVSQAQDGLNMSQSDRLTVATSRMSDVFNLFMTALNSQQPPPTTTNSDDVPPNMPPPPEPGATADEYLSWLKSVSDAMSLIMEARMDNTQISTATIPTYISSHSDKNNGTLYRPMEEARAGLKDGLDFAGRAFQALDAIQQSLNSSTNTPPSSAPSSSSTADRLALPFLQALISTIHSPPPSSNPKSVEKIPELQNTPENLTDVQSFMLDAVTEQYQKSETILRSGIQGLGIFLQSLPEDDPNYSFGQSVFGLLLLHLHEITWDDAELDGGVAATSLALSKHEAFKRSTPTLIRNWAYGQRLLAQRDRKVELLSLPIELLQSTFSISTKIDAIPSRVKQFLQTELATCLLNRYYAEGKLDDLDAAIEHLHSLTEGSDITQRMSCLLGSAHLQRFLQRGNLDDLDRSLYLAQHLSGATVETQYDVDEAATHHLLAMSLLQRFHLHLDTSDLDQAVLHCRAAIGWLKYNHPLITSYRSDLATLLLARFGYEGDLGDLTSSLVEIKLAVATEKRASIIQIPPRAILGVVLAIHGKENGDSSEVDEGVRALILARKNFSGPHLESYIEQYLAKALLHRFHLVKSDEDLDAAIYHASLAFQEVHENAPHWAQLGLELGNLHMASYEQNQDSAHIRDAVATFRRIAYSSGRPSVCLQAAINWANAMESSGPAGSLEALELALEILPSLAWAGDRMSVQYRRLVSLSSSIASRAAACAIDGGDLEKAVTYLESGRNILWAQALQLRTPELASHENNDELKYLSQFLSHQVHGGSFEATTEQINDIIQKTPPEIKNLVKVLGQASEEAKQRLVNLKSGNEDKVNEDFERIRNFKQELGDIYREASHHNAARRWTTLRSNLGQSGEALTPSRSFQALRDNGLHGVLEIGPVVIFNAYGIRCDAIVLTNKGDRVLLEQIPLPEMSGDQAQAWAETLRQGIHDMETYEITLPQYEATVLIPILRGLWKDVVLPVLEHLKATSKIPTRIWWYPTGQLAFLPIHAAGPYIDSEQGLPELIVSSYTPTLYSLIRAHNAPPAAFRILAMGQPDTPGHNPLPAIEREMRSIQEYCKNFPGRLTTLVSQEGTIHRVTKALPDHTWIHFSCHAHQDEAYPFHSSFFLHDGPFKLSKLMQLDLSHIQLAFLAACLTSAGDISLPDECIHLAAGMQFAGVRSAIATMWAVDDAATSFATRKFYQYLLRKDEPDPTEAAEALHTAVKEMKRVNLPLACRVPFIHTGI